MSKSEFPRKYIEVQCRVIAGCFVLSAVRGYDSEKFATTMLTNPYCVRIMTDDLMREYACDSFMLEGIEREVGLEKGLVYDADVMWLTGYLYKYAISIRGIEPKDLVKIAPISKIAARYEFYHTQGFEYIINDMIDR